MSHTPLAMTLNPRLDGALTQGWRTWEEVVRAEGIERTVKWATHRTQGEVPAADLRAFVEELLDAEDEETATFARAALAELVEESDDALAEILWEGVMEAGYDTDDPEVIFEAASHLAAIAEEYGDPLTAAEYWIGFLNWRRQADHASEVETVQVAFDEVIRLAEADGQPRIAALYSHWQVGFTRISGADEEAGTTGDWESDSAPYASWT